MGEEGHCHHSTLSKQCDRRHNKAHCLYTGSGEPAAYFRMNISVIICTKDRHLELSRLINSLNVQTLIPDELIIIDASVDDDTGTHVKGSSELSRYPIKYIKSSPGLTKQRNIGIREAKGKYVFFFDDDVVLDSDYIRIIMETFSHLQGVQLGGLTGR
ncbi:MAG: glycosyltransferase family 2 protein, partial [Desulfobacteraceae bacterium]|nr:glycosyltransferase family 2 protein [Desulfobacteraceae bacterium]